MHTLSFALSTLLVGGASAQLLGGMAPAGSELPLSRTAIVGDAVMSCTYMELGDDMVVNASLTCGGGGFFLVFGQLGWGDFAPGSATYLATGVLDREGEGSARALLPGHEQFPRNYGVAFYALYPSKEGWCVTPPSLSVMNPWPVEVLDFDYAAGGERLQGGEPIRGQWADAGIHIWAENAHPDHPDLAVLFDSDHPTGDDFDLSTPGYGWQNRTPAGKLLIIAENDGGLERTGYVAEPDDEAMGGTIFFRFESPVRLSELTLIDVDASETVEVRSFGARERVDWAVMPGAGDNARQALGFGADEVRELQVEFSGSGAIAELVLMPCPVRVGFDTTTTGAPAGLTAGEPFADQLGQSLGFRLTAQGRRGYPDVAVVFDTGAPTGRELDLATPGYHRTNFLPLGRALVLADNAADRDQDGLIDDPGASDLGGSMTIDFAYDVIFSSATVIDVDAGERSFLAFYDADGWFLGRVLLDDLGDNSVQTVTPGFGGVRRVVLDLGGSSALAGFEFCRDPSWRSL